MPNAKFIGRAGLLLMQVKLAFHRNIFSGFSGSRPRAHPPPPTPRTRYVNNLFSTGTSISGFSVFLRFPVGTGCRNKSQRFTKLISRRDAKCAMKNLGKIGNSMGKIYASLLHTAQANNRNLWEIMRCKICELSETDENFLQATCTKSGSMDQYATACEFCRVPSVRTDQQKC